MSQKRPSFVSLFSFACIVAIPLGLSAADQPSPSVETNITKLDPIVVSGSPVKTTTFAAPYSVNSVSIDPIKNAQLGVNLSEALAGVPGLVIQNRQNYAQDLQISIRGFGARAAFGVRGIKLIADGIPATDPDGQGQAATFNLDTAERIEVLRGPFAVIYGNSSGGVIQLFSRDGKGDPSVYAGASGGSWGTTKFTTGSEGEVDGVGYVVEASRFQTDVYRQHSAATRYQEFAKVTFQPDSQSRLTLVAGGLDQPDSQDALGVTWASYKQNPRTASPAAIAFNTRKSIDHAQGGAVYERQLGDYNSVETVVYAGDRKVTQFQAIPVGAQLNPTNSGGVVAFDRDFEGVGARWIFQRDAGPGDFSLTAGFDFDRANDDRQGYENFVGPTLGVQGALRRNEDDLVLSVAPYLQAVWDWDKLQLSAGVRESWVHFNVDDHFLANGNDSGSVDYSRPTPVFGVLYRLVPKVNLYGSVGEGFETPSLNELFYSGAGGGFNFHLKAASSLQEELGVKAFVTDSTRVNAAVFQIHTSHELVVASSTGGRTAYDNAGDTLRQGAEFEIESDLTRQLTATGSFTFLRAVYDQSFVSSGNTIPDGNHIPGIPEYAAYGQLAWRPLKGLTLAAETIYRSEVFVEDRNTAPPAPAHVLENLWAAADQTFGRWTFSEMFRVDNIADIKHIDSVIIGDTNARYYEPGPARSFFGGVQVSYKF